MNNKAQVLIFSLMLGVTMIVLILALAGPIKTQIDATRNATGLNCTNPAITSFDKATCVVVDINMAYFIGGVLFIAGAVIGAKIFFGS